MAVDIGTIAARWNTNLAEGSLRNPLNNHILQQPQLDECFLDLSITLFADTYFS